MAQDSFKAMVLTQEDEETRHEIQDLTTEDLPEEGDVLVSVEYSSLNYKDAMAVTGTGKIVRSWPMVPGIDLALALRALKVVVLLGPPRPVFGVAKHRLFVWLEGATLPDSATIAFARDDDYFFGVLHSGAHEAWALRMGTSLEDRPRYTPTTCFETFPFPKPTEEQREGITAAARRLDGLRRNWLNPDGASEVELKKRTLTNLYNTRPTWLANAHAALDRAVFAAYGWPEDISDEEILKNLLALNLERSGEQGLL